MKDFDAIQQVILLVFSFAMWAAFEYWCFKDSTYAALPHTGAVRLILTNLITGIFTHIYTKTLPNGKKKQEQKSPPVHFPTSSNTMRLSFMNSE